LLSVLHDLSKSLKTIADFCSAIHLTNKGRIGTNDYGTFMSLKFFAQTLRSIDLSLQKISEGNKVKLNN
jgi:hypothetical protein